MTSTCVGWQVFSHDPWAPGSCSSYSLPLRSPPLNPERYVVMSHIGNALSSWHSVWTPSPQLHGNSQVCSSPQLPGNSQVGWAYYKRGCLPSPLSLTLLLLLSYSHPGLTVSAESTVLEQWSMSSPNELVSNLSQGGLTAFPATAPPINSSHPKDSYPCSNQPEPSSCLWPPTSFSALLCLRVRACWCQPPCRPGTQLAPSISAGISDCASPSP